MRSGDATRAGDGIGNIMKFKIQKYIETAMHQRIDHLRTSSGMQFLAHFNAAELAALLKRDTERWAPLVKTIGFTAES